MGADNVATIVESAARVISDQTKIKMNAGEHTESSEEYSQPDTPKNHNQFLEAGFLGERCFLRLVRSGVSFTEQRGLLGRSESLILFC